MSRIIRFSTANCENFELSVGAQFLTLQDGFLYFREHGLHKEMFRINRYSLFSDKIHGDFLAAEKSGGNIVFYFLERCCPCQCQKR
jgi:hypothetical protein